MSPDWDMFSPSEEESNFTGSSSASDITSSGVFRGDHSSYSGRRITSTPPPSETGRISSETSSIASGDSICSSGPQGLSFCGSSTKSVLGSSPCFSAPRQAYASFASWSHIPAFDDIPNAPPESSAASPRQHSRPSSTNSEETVESELESNYEESEPKRLPTETATTTDAFAEEDIIFTLDAEHHVQELATPQHLALADLILFDDYPPLIRLSNTIDDALDFLQSCSGRSASSEPKSWIHVREDDRWSWNSGIGAPPLNNGYTFLDKYVYDSGSDYDDEVSQQSYIYPGLNISEFSPEALSNIFYPDFAFAHLSTDSVESFSDELIQGGLAISTEYHIQLFLGFGPSIPLEVCTFTPRRRKDLQSFRKVPGEVELQVEESLPIAIDFFEAGLQYRDIDEWLDSIIDDKSEFQEYVAFMLHKKNGSLPVQMLQCLVEWYLASRNKSPTAAYSNARTALKLLMTTTLMSLVPKLEEIPEDLSRYLSPQPASFDRAPLSKIAPKLLNRQIKASLHYLQRKLLRKLFYYLANHLEIHSEVNVAIALLMAFVLELARKAGRDFATYATKVNPNIVVQPHKVPQYESNVNTQVFNRILESVRDSGKLGNLGERLKNMGSTIKVNNEAEEDQCQYVSILLNNIIRS